MFSMWVGLQSILNDERTKLSGISGCLAPDEMKNGSNHQTSMIRTTLVIFN